MDHSALTFRSKDASSVPARQVPTAIQPQLPAIDGSTTVTIESSTRTLARTPAHPNAPAPRVRPWDEARVGAPNIDHEAYNVPVMQPSSNSPAPRVWVLKEPRGAAPNTYNEGHNVPLTQPTSSPLAMITETSADTSDAIVAANACTTAITPGSALPSALHQGRALIRVPANQTAPNALGHIASYCEYTTGFYIDPATLQPAKLTVPVLAKLILKDALEAKTLISETTKWWSGRLAAHSPDTREFEIVNTVLALIDQQDPNYPLRVKQREEAKQLEELEDNLLKHKVTSETDVPSYKFPYKPRKIAPLKKVPNKASYIPGGNKATGQPSAIPGHMPVFGQSGGGISASKATAQPGVSPAFQFKMPDFGGRDAGIRRVPKE